MLQACAPPQSQLQAPPHFRSTLLACAQGERAPLVRALKDELKTVDSFDPDAADRQWAKVLAEGGVFVGAGTRHTSSSTPGPSAKKRRLEVEADADRGKKEKVRQAAAGGAGRRRCMCGPHGASPRAAGVRPLLSGSHQVHTHPPPLRTRAQKDKKDSKDKKEAKKEGKKEGKGAEVKREPSGGGGGGGAAPTTPAAAPPPAAAASTGQRRTAVVIEDSDEEEVNLAELLKRQQAAAAGV
jgi:hypothetical protein